MSRTNESSLTFPCRVLSHSAYCGDVNMAIDNEMLTKAVGGTATLRTYQWSSPTISLGYFQSRQAESVPQRFANLAIVERLSGGGAILHDRELTYSLALPKSHPLTATPTRIYDAVHDVIIRLLSEHGIQAHLRGDAAFADKSFLCYSRGDERDILIGTNKIVGSAQRRREGAVLQHGSILLHQSEHAPEFPGIAELTGQTLCPFELAKRLEPAILDGLHLFKTD